MLNLFAPNSASVTQAGGRRTKSLDVDRPTQLHRDSSRTARDRVEDDSIKLEHMPLAELGQRDEASPPAS